MNESLGSIECVEQRCLVFPNLFQHKVSKFELKDNTKPGHRKILVFFLVDPTQRISLSTSRIPPSDCRWLLDPVEKILKETTKLPSDVRAVVFEYQSYFGSGMSLEQAKKHRANLMDERKNLVIDNNQIFEREFSLCEH